MRVRRGSQRFSDPAGDPARWAGWRVQRLLAAGFPRPLAKRLAADSRIDVHSLLELVDHGCPPHLAVRIMAPLDWDPSS
jgi:hypothetical protein